MAVENLVVGCFGNEDDDGDSFSYGVAEGLARPFGLSAGLWAGMTTLERGATPPRIAGHCSNGAPARRYAGYAAGATDL